MDSEHITASLDSAGHASRYATGHLKWTFDLVGGAVLSIVSLPLVVLLAIGSAISFRAWPFFVQERLGHNGRPFRFVKLRTLPVDTPVSLDKYALVDVRTTRWGRFLRSRHLDELPQLWLLVSGRMSLIGPRPEMPVLAASFDETFVQERMLVRPGITGTWQLSEHKVGLIGEVMVYDRLYVRHATLWLDLHLTRRTVTCFFGAAPLTLDELQRWFLRHGVTDTGYGHAPE